MERAAVRVAWALYPLVGIVLVAGCGGSVAGLDRVEPTRAPAGPPSPFCAAVQASSAATTPLSGRSGVPPEELSNTVDAVRLANDDLVQTAPDEIRDDVEQYVAALDLQLDALLANGGDSTALATDAALASAVNTPENVAANQRVQEYVRTTCSAAAG